MYIANSNNCWFTNVGEAFIDIGVKNIIHNLKEKHNDIQYGTISPMTKYYIGDICGDNSPAFNNTINICDWFMPDLLIMPGMYLTSEMVNNLNGMGERDTAVNIKKKGGKVAFLGAGGYKYDEEERRNVIKFMDEIQPAFVITRDKKTYDMYKDYVECKRGLDCAFWVNDSFNPKNMTCNKYVVSTFNRSDEPYEVQNLDNLIHPWHMQYHLNIKKTKFLSKQNIMVSDSPYEYLTLYANADKVYTDLVHATIPSLVYGTPVKYYRIDNRRDAFESIPYLEYDEQGFMSINLKKLEKNKKEIELYIDKCLYK